ncbi:MAG: aldo/keto reductase, partial [Chitinophagaceae bacterium]
KKIISSSLQESLAALQTDHIDLFMLHQADLPILQNEAVSRVFAELKQSGLIRATGASTYAADETKMAVESRAWDVIQLPFNLMDQRQKEVFPLAKEHGVGLVIRSVLMKGLLTNKGKGLHPALKNVEDHIKNYAALIDARAKDLSTVATKFVLSFEEVSSVLIGIDSLDYLRQSIESADGFYFDEAKISKAKSLAYPDPAFLDLPRWDRLGWLK